MRGRQFAGVGRVYDALRFIVGRHADTAFAAKHSAMVAVAYGTRCIGGRKGSGFKLGAAILIKPIVLRSIARFIAAFMCSLFSLCIRYGLATVITAPLWLHYGP